MAFTSHPNAGSISSSLFPSGEESEPRAISISRASVPLTDGDEQMADYAIPHSSQTSASASGSPTVTANQLGTYMNNRHLGLIPNQGGAGPSDLQSSLASLKTRFNAMSMRYKETISKSTRGWRERLFSRNSSMDGLTPESRSDSNSGISNISHRIEGLQAAREDSGADVASPAVVADAVTEQLYLNNEEIHHHGAMRNEGNAGARTTGSVSS